MEQKNWFMSHKIITGLLVFFVFIFFISILGGGKEPTKIDAVQTNEAGTSNYVIEVTGSEGLEFQGSIGSGGNQKSVQGVVPMTYEASSWPAVAVIQKEETKGTLRVTIKKNGNVLNSQETDADYGIVTVSSG